MERYPIPTVYQLRNIVTASSQESINHQFRPEIFIINLYHRLKSCSKGHIPNTLASHLSLSFSLSLSDPLSHGQATPRRFPCSKNDEEGRVL